MFKRLLLPLLLALAFAPNALASGGNYTFDGGSRAEQGQVKAALNASSFDWGIIPGPVVIHIAKGVTPHAVSTQIWLDADLLDSGRFSWGVTQHEYAHQIDFAVLTDPMRATLHTLLGGTSWWSGTDHAQLDCERFADLVASAYWQSPDNVMTSAAAADGAAQVSPAAFRAALDSVLPVAPTRVLAASKVKKAHQKG